MTTIYFDMDGTIADLYGVDNWLADLRAARARPYREAKPLVNMRRLGYLLNKLKNRGYRVGIVSWLAKVDFPGYGEKVAKTKQAWLKKHLSAVEWDEIVIVPYGVPKQNAVLFADDSILFDDEEKNRVNWTGTAYDVDNIIEILESLL